MRALSNLGYYLNYLNILRGDNTIINYFSSNENYQAIKELTEEGYPQFYDEFCQIVESYSNLYPLNTSELRFIKKIERKNISKALTKNNNNYISWDIKVTSEFNYIKFFKECNKNINEHYQIEILKCEKEVMRKNLEQIWPITEAVILRRFCKKLLEMLIKKNINLIDVENYIPDVQILNNYALSLSKNYMAYMKNKKEESIDIEKEVKIIISNIENNNKLDVPKDKKKKNPKLKYYNEDHNDIKVIKSMLKMKTQCNQIINFNKKFADNLNINDYIYNNFQIINDEFSFSLEEEEEEEEEEKKSEGPKVVNIINISNEPKPKKDKNISISNVARFIAYGQPAMSTLKSLETFSENITVKAKEIQKLINKLEKKKNNSDIDDRINDMNSIKSSIDEELPNLVINDYENPLSNDKISAFAKYFKNNFLNINDIPYNEVTINNNPIDRKYIDYFNDLRRRMSIKNKLKFNVTFEANIYLINISKELNKIISKLENIRTINNSINDLNRYYNEEMGKLNTEINNIKISIDFIKREQFFTEINQVEFVKTLESDFQTEQINYLNDEINNFYLYIYLLKRNVYDEKSYKFAIVNDDYM